MAVSIGKFAPTAIVLAAVGYCCWPYLEDPGHRPKMEEKKLPEIAASVLSPTIKPAPGRDPFGMTGEVDMFKVLEASTGKKGATKPGEGPPAKKLTPAEEKAAREKEKEEAAKKAAEAAEIARKAVAQDLKVALNSTTLNATYLRGTHHVAVINREVFKEGQTLDNLSTRPIKIAKIAPRKVLLELEGQTVELTYETSSTSQESGPPVPDAVPTVKSIFSPARPVSLTAPARNAGPRTAPDVKPRDPEPAVATP